jgi:hypothetical protein
MRSLDVLEDERLINEVGPQIEKLEKSEKDGFNRYIRKLMTYQLPQPQNDVWEQ